MVFIYISLSKTLSTGSAYLLMERNAALHSDRVQLPPDGRRTVDPLQVGHRQRRRRRLRRQQRRRRQHRRRPGRVVHRNILRSSRRTVFNRSPETRFSNERFFRYGSGSGIPAQRFFVDAVLCRQVFVGPFDDLRSSVGSR